MYHPIAQRDLLATTCEVSSVRLRIHSIEDVTVGLILILVLMVTLMLTVLGNFSNIQAKML